MTTAQQSLPLLPFVARTRETSGKVNKLMSIYQIVVKGLLNGSGQLRNVMHYEFPGYTPNDTELQSFVDNLDDDFRDYLEPLYASTVALTGYGVRRVDIGDQPEFEFIPTAGTWVGDDAGTQLPPQVSAMVTWKAPTAYPRTCRSYLWPMTESGNSTAGSIEATYRTAIFGWATDSMTVVVAGQSSAQRVAVEYGGDPRVVTAANVVETASNLATWRTQRRRRLGVGA